MKKIILHISLFLVLVFSVKAIANTLPTAYTHPNINSVYSQGMRRVNSIPLYGKNKYMYFSNTKYPDDADFHDSGLYLFGSYAYGQVNNGVNVEDGKLDEETETGSSKYLGGSDANNSMGKVSGFSLGVGREMSSSLSVEFEYASFFNMNYGKFAKFWEEAEEEDEEEAEEENKKKKKPSKSESSEVVNSSRKVSGGDISSDFIGLGFRYNLDRYIGSFGGRLKPYFGFKLGVAQNTINDYSIEDNDGYSKEDKAMTDYTDDEYANLATVQQFTSDSYENGELTVIGKSSRTLGTVFETGVSLSLEGDLQIDLFYKFNKLGKVSSSGHVIANYDVTTTTYYKPSAGLDLGDNACDQGGRLETVESADGNPIGFCVVNSNTDEGIQEMYKDQKESGNMNFSQYGIKLRYLF